jgi:exodeoxyribonuclease VII large subunit
MRYIPTVSEINKYIKEILCNDIILSNLWVRGEISNFKHHYSGICILL